MNKIITLIIIILAVAFFWPKAYTSSPGFVTAEMVAEFEANKPACYGWSYLTNAGAMAADAPGKSLCFGWLAQ